MDETATEGLASLTDAAGAIRRNLVETRPADDEPAGPRSLLPEPTASYTSAAPISADEVETLAPLVPAATRRRVEAEVSDLDRRVELWFADRCPMPRVTLLGPVKAVTNGDAMAAAKRPAHLTALLTYIATRPHGATTAEIADALEIPTDRVRKDIYALRRWLGTNPRTGRNHLPTTGPNGERAVGGVTVYQLEDVLVDLLLFEQLRARGMARGAHGLEDLKTALSLVEGEPFQRATTKSWAWVFEGNRLDSTATASVLDVASTVKAQAILDGDAATAQWALMASQLACPVDESSATEIPVTPVRTPG